MTVTITREFGFDMGHMLPDHQGGCYRPHGHRYRCQVTITGEEQTSGPERGMVRDFAALGSVIQWKVVEGYDHRFAVCMDDKRLEGMRDVFSDDDLVIVADPPTAENLARWIGEHLSVALSPCKVVRVKLWETPNCSAEWTP